MNDHEPAHADTPAEPGEWLRLPDAAMRLHINLRTVHAYVKDGRLTRRKLPRGRTEVWVPDSLVPEEPPESPQMSTQGTSLAAMSQHMMLLERQGEIAAQQMAPLLAALDARDETIRELEREAERLRGELARHVTPDAPPTPPFRRRWWHRLLFGGE
jgi:hypothetical protein